MVIGFIYYLLAPTTLVVLATYISVAAGWNDSGLRIIGVVFQVFGIWTVARNFVKLRARFSRPDILETMWRRAKSRFQRIFGKRKDAIVMGGVGNISAFGSAFVTGWVSLGPNSSPAQRINALEKNIESLKNLFEHKEKQHSEEVSKIRERLNKIKSQTDKAIESINKKIVSLNMDGLFVAELGVIILIAGVVLGTVSQELVDVAAYVVRTS